jgi:hypothetical protein
LSRLLDPRGVSDVRIELVEININIRLNVLSVYEHKKESKKEIEVGRIFLYSCNTFWQAGALTT